MSKVNIPSKPQAIKLQHPFTTDAGIPVEQVQVKSITVRQMKQAQRAGGGDDVGVETAMVAVACDLVPEDLDKMQMIDYVAVRERFQQLNLNSASRQVDESAGTAS